MHGSICGLLERCGIWIQEVSFFPFYIRSLLRVSTFCGYTTLQSAWDCFVISRAYFFHYKLSSHLKRLCWIGECASRPPKVVFLGYSFRRLWNSAFNCGSPSSLICTFVLMSLRIFYSDHTPMSFVPHLFNFSRRVVFPEISKGGGPASVKKEWNL